MKNSRLVQRDLKTVWHPCTQMKDHEKIPMIPIKNGKGVYGLQRAIQIAGAEAIIISMWKVSDNATQKLMRYFYAFWIEKGMNKRKAFNSAKLKLREEYSHPYYWGAFIFLGN